MSKDFGLVSSAAQWFLSNNTHNRSHSLKTTFFVCDLLSAIHTRSLSFILPFDSFAVSPSPPPIRDRIHLNLVMAFALENTFKSL